MKIYLPVIVLHRFESIIISILCVFSYLNIMEATGIGLIRLIAFDIYI